MAHKLPVELWQRIGDYLPNEDIINLESEFPIVDKSFQNRRIIPTTVNDTSFNVLRDFLYKSNIMNTEYNLVPVVANKFSESLFATQGKLEGPFEINVVDAINARSGTLLYTLRGKARLGFLQGTITLTRPNGVLKLSVPLNNKGQITGEAIVYADTGAPLIVDRYDTQGVHREHIYFNKETGEELFHKYFDGNGHRIYKNRLV
jgi:antitoxin component YwqK of YwqJK toxin-antitoxin module